MRSPDRLQAVEWLTKARGAGDWPAVLEALGAGPMVALGVDPAAVADVGRESRETLESLCAGSTDPVAAAERWSRSELELRLGCFEKWLTEHVHRRALAGSFLREMRAASYLPEAGAFLNIRELFGLVDAVRDMRATLDVPLNRGLALEALFRRLAPAGSGRGGGQG